MSKGDKRRHGKGYGEGFERIFGDKKAVTSFKRFGGDSGVRRSSLYVVSDIEPFRSPVTGEIISSRSQLREHNKVNGVTDSRDYSKGYYEKHQKDRNAGANGVTECDKADRIELIKAAMSGDIKRRQRR